MTVLDCFQVFEARKQVGNGYGFFSLDGNGGARGDELGDTASPAWRERDLRVGTLDVGTRVALWQHEHRRQLRGPSPCECRMCRSIRGQRHREASADAEQRRIAAAKRLKNKRATKHVFSPTIQEQERLKLARLKRETAAVYRRERKAKKLEEQVRVLVAIEERRQAAYETPYQQLRRLKQNIPVRLFHGEAFAGLAVLSNGIDVELSWCTLGSVFGEEDAAKIKAQIQRGGRYIFNPKTRIVALVHLDPYQEPVW